MRRVAAVLLCLALAAPAQAQAPTLDEAIAEVTRLLDQPDRALDTDVYITDALAAARAEGPLHPDWIILLNTGAVLTIGGLCRYERGFALLDEAAALGDLHNRPFLRDQTRAWRAFYEAGFGLRDAARARLEQLAHPLEDLLQQAQREELAAHLASDAAPDESAGFRDCVRLMGEASALMKSGDFEQARSIAAGMYLPEALLVTPELRATNAAIGSMAASAMRVVRDPGYDRMIAAIIADLSVPGSDPATLRPALLEGDTTRAIVIDALSTAADQRDITPAADTARRWLEEIADVYGRGTYAQITTALDQALLAADWPEAARLSRALAAHPDAGAAYERLHNVQALVFDNFAAVARGEAIDHDALADSFAATMADDDLPLPNKLDTANLVTQAFDLGQIPYLAWVGGEQSFYILQYVMGQANQSADGIISFAKGFRRTADIAIRNGFDIAAQPPNGETPPAGLCQEIVGIEICTIVVARP
ncbi:MAG: hypothetical protein AAFY38_14340 [Pseudomonadota bacterium]